MDEDALSKCYRRTTDTRFRAMGDEGMVIHQRAGEVVVLNETGTRILGMIDGATSVDKLLKALADEYQVQSTTLHNDVQTYLQELETAGIIEEVVP